MRYRAGPAPSGARNALRAFPVHHFLLNHPPSLGNLQPATSHGGERSVGRVTYEMQRPRNRHTDHENH
jgi:hypothetical protein